MHVWHAQIDESDGWRLLQGCGIANQVHASQGTLRRGQPQAAGHHITWLVDGGAKAPTGVPPRMRTRTALDVAPSFTILWRSTSSIGWRYCGRRGRTSATSAWYGARDSEKSTSFPRHRPTPGWTPSPPGPALTYSEACGLTPWDAAGCLLRQAHSASIGPLA